MKQKVIFIWFTPKLALMSTFLVSTGILILISCGGGGSTGSSVTSTSEISAPTGVALSGVSTTTVGSNTFTSSSKIKVDWVKPDGVTVDHYKVEAVDNTGGATISETVVAGTTTITLADLKADTTYSITVTACGDATESVKASAVAVTRKTSTEYWQLQGSGNAVSGLTKIVSDGNARISATRIGSEAGGITANHIQLYYGPSGSGGRSVLITALSNSAVDSTVITSYTSFTTTMSGTNATNGLASPSTGVDKISTVWTGQGVPLSSSMGGNIRLFFEASGTDSKTRIFSVDSVDGYIGQDFNTGSSKVCITTADYSTGGGCKFVTEVGVEGDSEKANLKISNARQNKIGWPTLTDWRWDGSAGTFMVFTTDSISGCSTAFMNHGYAIYDGSKWVVQYETGGCPKLFTNAQAAFPIHIGGKKYKMYYGDPSITSGKVNGSPLPFPGPKNLIYADGDLTSTAQVDFEDWESQAKARDVVFLWPDNSMLNAKEEGYIDDYHFLTPTGDLSIQVMYLAITDGTTPPIASSAILLNP